MRWIALIILFCPFLVNAHEIQSITQHVDIKKQKTSGWQQDLLARIDLNRKFDLGAQATYFERFDIYDKRLGAFMVYRPTDSWTLEASYLQGKGNDILPEKETTLSAYHAASEGLSPYVTYKDIRYSVTTLHMVNLGIEIEKISGFIIIPSLMLGRASFKSPSDTKGVHNYGLRVGYYQEKKYGVALFAYQGKEASQGIIGASNILVDTLTGGGAFTWYFTQDIKSELTIYHTDYDQLNTQFLTSTLNLSWMF